MNAIINFGQRPPARARGHPLAPGGELPRRRRRAASAGASPARPASAGSCRTQTEMVPNILKGGEDSIGFDGAVQRVYFNIGSCSEQCWVNHITDLRQADPKQRNFGQSPFDIGQCRRDCPNFRAIEDRLDDIVAFLVTARPSDLYQAQRATPRRAISRSSWSASSATGAVDRGREVFAANCARCHSRAGRAVRRQHRLPRDRSRTIRRCGSTGSATTQPTPVDRGRHATTRARCTPTTWRATSGRSTARRPCAPGRAVADLDEIRKGGGRGYYRNISLLSVWAHAPFMHNNAIGPELCGGPDDTIYVSPYVGAERQAAAAGPGAAVLAVRPERRGPLRAVPGVGRSAAQPGPARCPRSPR